MFNANSPIFQWYHELKEVTGDDKADFEVMLEDTSDSQDAEDAIVGMIFNTLERGLNPTLFMMAMSATEEGRLPMIQDYGEMAVLIFAILYDRQFRNNQDLIDAFLEMLSLRGDKTLKNLCYINRLKKNVVAIGMPIEIRNTLVFSLVVVGEEANRAFDRSC